MTDATRPGPRPETAFFAHSLDGRPTSQWQLLSDHSQAVARLAREFAAAFAQAGVAELLDAWTIDQLMFRNPEGRTQ